MCILARIFSTVARIVFSVWVGREYQRSGDKTQHIYAAPMIGIDRRLSIAGPDFDLGGNLQQNVGRWDCREKLSFSAISTMLDRARIRQYLNHDSGGKPLRPLA
jgi:hypothetical protein